MAIAFRWSDDGVMVPLRPKLADAEFCVGAEYLLEEVKLRSINNHNHYFVRLSELWHSLPDDQAMRFLTPDALRRYALVMTGWRDERTIVAESKAAAQRISSFIKPMDEHAVITVRECVVRVWTAKSQSMKAMGKDDFNRSKQDVLAFVEDMIGVKPEQLAKEGQSA